MGDSAVAVVTGSSRGIGAALVNRLVQQGYRVIGCSRSTPEWELEGYEHHLLDIGDEGAVRSLFSQIQKMYGRLDVLINNAGAASMNHSLLTPAATVSRLLETNVLGTFLASREAAKLMQRRKFGRIVNIGSFGVPLEIEGEAAYVASKSAVVSLSRVMARELAPWQITVNVVGPTPIETAMIRNVPKEKIQNLVSQLPIKRLGTFEDVLNVVEFFLRRESDNITGQVIYLGGAW